jgi:predicted DNA-binding transcriptional regulator AlpA
MTDQYLTVRDLSNLMHIDEDTIRKWRQRDVGPPSTKLVGRIVYVESDVHAWIAEQTRIDAQKRLDAKQAS